MTASRWWTSAPDQHDDRQPLWRATAGWCILITRTAWGCSIRRMTASRWWTSGDPDRREQNFTAPRGATKGVFAPTARGFSIRLMTASCSWTSAPRSTRTLSFSAPLWLGDGRVVFAPAHAEVFTPSPVGGHQRHDQLSTINFLRPWCSPLITPTAWGVFDPTDDSFSLVDISATIIRRRRCVGDGRVVFAPRHAHGVGVFDPTNDSFSLVDIRGTIDEHFMAPLWRATAGWCSPLRGPDSVGVFDPTDDSFTLVDISTTISIGL